jgi:hypothetical protein
MHAAGLPCPTIVSGRGLGGFFLQSEMHAFMTAVLLRMAWPGAFDANTQAQPHPASLPKLNIFRA